MNRVPATVAIRRRSVPNVDTDRLVRRFAHLLRLLADPRGLPGARLAFGQRAAELVNVRNELMRRNVLSPSMDAAARQHVADQVLALRGGLL